MSSSDQQLLLLSPAFVLSVYFVGGFLIYGARTLVKGPYRDAEMESRGSTVFVGMFLRLWFAWMMVPLWSLIRSSRITPNGLTLLALFLAICSGISLGLGHFALGGWLFIFAGWLDFFDGKLARSTGRVTRAGSALDSTIDRYCEGVVLVGLGWFYRETWVLLVIMLAMLGSLQTSYVRAKGESLGVEMQIGQMQRVERAVYLGIPLVLSPVLNAFGIGTGVGLPHIVVVIGLVVLALSSHVTSLTRLVHLLRHLSQAEKE